MVEIYFMVLHIFYTLTSVCTHMGKRMSLRIWATNCSCHTTRVPCFWRFHNNLAHLCVAVVLPPICRARGEQMFPRVLPPLALVMRCLCRVSHMQHTWLRLHLSKYFEATGPWFQWLFLDNTLPTFKSKRSSTAPETVCIPLETSSKPIVIN